MGTPKFRRHTIQKRVTAANAILKWVGDKLQVTETEDEGYHHIITDIVRTGSNHTDYEELAHHSRAGGNTPIQAGRALRRCRLHERAEIGTQQKLEIDLIGSLPGLVTPQELLPDGITQAQFQVNPDNKIITCPKDYQATNPSLVGNTLSFRFPQKI